MINFSGFFGINIVCQSLRIITFCHKENIRLRDMDCSCYFVGTIHKYAGFVELPIWWLVFCVDVMELAWRSSFYWVSK